MPATRRKSGTSAASQSTLSFNNKPSRVTKPSTVDPNVKKSTSKLSEPAEAQIFNATSSTPELESAEIVVKQSPKKSPVRSRPKKSTNVEVKDQAETVAEKVTDAQLKKYWKAEEDSRLAPRVHQESITQHEKILRHFDLSSQYGPCIGIPRLRRWKRANTLSLNPPIEVLAVLLREEKRSTGSGKIAYIDELGGGKRVLVD